MKLKWKVGDKPTGRYRSFQKRSWPTATFGTEGEMAAMIQADESYSAKIAESTEVRLYVADHREKPWRWRKFKNSFPGVTKAKSVAEDFFRQRPEWMPDE